MLLQVACNQSVIQGDLLQLLGLEKWNNFSFFFWLMDCRDGGVRMVGRRGGEQPRTVDIWVCGWSFVVGLWLVFARNEPFGWGDVFIF